MLCYNGEAPGVRPPKRQTHGRSSAMSTPKYRSNASRFNRYMPVHWRMWGRCEPSRRNCLEYQGPRDRDGYGRVTHKGQAWQAPRLAWTILNGEIPSNLMVLHTCDNPPCINPDHLFLGTAQDNMDDKRFKGRSRYLRGESCPGTKLTAIQVREIRRRVATGECYRTIARDFGISRTHVSTIQCRRSWRHI